MKELDSNPIYYVYQLTIEGDSSPFYVGKGYGSRVFQHEKEARANKNPNSHKENKIRKAIRENKLILVSYIKQHLCEDDALMWEAFWVSEYGRADLGFGPLTNRTDGGDDGTGGYWTVETRKLHSEMMKEFIRENGHPKGMKDKKHSEETIEKFKTMRSGDNNKHLGLKRNDLTKELMSQKKKGLVPVICIATNQNLLVSKEDFHKNRNLYRTRTEGKTFDGYYNSGKVTAFDLLEKKTVKISKEDFDREKGYRYVGINSKLYKEFKLINSL